jgi:hypothetical protein
VCDRVLCLFLAVGAISAQDEDFPTADSSGIRDRDDHTSLALDAVKLVEEQKDDYDKQTGASGDLVCEKNRMNNEETCEISGSSCSCGMMR